MTRPRKLVQGIGINDMPVGYAARAGPEKPVYDRWNNLLLRVGGGKDNYFYKERPTYRDTTICEEWLTLSNFAVWIKSHEGWEEKTIDKDILCPRNKHYSPETCVLVSHDLNNLLCDSAARRGKYPKGVVKDGNRYRATVGGVKNRNNVGNYATVEEAHRAACQAKAEYIREVAENLTDADTSDIERTRAGLLEHADIEERLWKDTRGESVPTLWG
jgi:hypothetical protein